MSQSYITQLYDIKKKILEQIILYSIIIAYWSYRIYI